MKIHREGYPVIGLAIVVLILLNLGVFYLFGDYSLVLWLLASLSIVFLGLIVQFFKFPSRPVNPEDQLVLSPSDGKVVVIEKVHEPEYFKDERIQISIFMSPLNVHAQWHPTNGVVKYMKYHPGKYLVAWHPKSSTDNERTTMVVEHQGRSVLTRQIAGAVARRIKFYVKEGDAATQGHEFGFIKFGSRLDVFLPLDANIKVKMHDKVKGAETILAEFL